MKETETKNTDGFPERRYRKLTNQEADRRYDLCGPIGFHGFSCERWTSNFQVRPLRPRTEDDTLKEEKDEQTTNT
ncbi:MAG: hypothetical protein A2700_02045 [Candidatus Blackburnbacteria bacterium RIFCSPHIGHO2_01_FULL_44_64]|uniref:Uncharacterized protein n=1 Tax=Candidatus Blackburnbacteria bacterium RIFCSPHIGHO2_02_FULL_44_20 TaxID=1797516 RepID=A0A1G1V851_9BACT|nr:MAG: hypothetical protein A2700_02045 [Candidatus Blackburnbacteria bacterium RIFCSPHIGHO2_01_FULL_44_64]OGY11184.1 MAG: hypothetical protein A3E16_00270 [Candidatus Blackburnbacteria bacterium RIFCSPHIGHO2_12_FULL_44_25]OGY11471.1 MAG: hypothetical protein A3D26_04580 [Candidatus Blackburnbacteria bacterium RIFCSPHIGHO2_02_FULL_44_20]OGY17009.1 MAG: hypothetical protein A3H88_01725 [Candidatus Blackburnbacteria bacterium RIFCSPLOWO2_02_FULL_44_9]